MKRLSILAALLLAVAGSALAQSVTGVWSYKSPAAKVEGVDFGSRMGNSMFNSMIRSGLKKEIAHDLDSLGLTRKSCTLALDAGGSFRMSTSEGFVKGTYKYDAAVGSLTLAVNNGHVWQSSAEFDGRSKMELMCTLEQYCGFIIMVSLAKYKGDIPDSAMEEIRAAQEKSSAEIKELRDGMKRLGERLKEAGEEENGDISREDAERMARAFADMEIYMGAAFAE